MRGIRWAIALLAVLVVGIIPATADTFTFTLNIGNTSTVPPDSALSSLTGPYATVTVTTPSLNSTTATITFDSLDNGGYLYLMADGSSVGVNVNATNWTISDITGTNSLAGFTPGPYSDNGSKNVDGFGTFNQTVKGFDGFTHSATEISFTLNLLGGGTWADAAAVLIANSSGHMGEIHGFACADPCSSTGSAYLTGFASNGPSAVPEPASLALFGSGLIGLGGIVRKRHLGRG